MIKANKTLNTYIFHLLIIGVLVFITGISVSVLAFRATETTVIFIPIVLLGSGFIYFISLCKAKGGNVNYYFTPHTPTENEKILSQLIEKNRNIFLITTGALILIIVEISMVVVNLDNNQPVSFDYLVGVFLRRC